MTDADRAAFEKWWERQGPLPDYISTSAAWRAAIAYATEQHSNSHIGASHPKSVAVQGAEADRLPLSGQPEPPAAQWANTVQEAVKLLESEHYHEATLEDRGGLIAALAYDLASNEIVRAETAEKALAQAVEAEREACAKVAYDEAETLGGNDSAQAWLAARRIAAAIRSRKSDENT